MSDAKPVQVTRTFLPPLDEFLPYLEGIWERNYVTNNGPLVQELEARLKEYFAVRHLFLVCNGTIALQIAIKALGLHGEVITTPFSYVATTSSIVWEGCIPVFVDIDPETLCLNPDLIEEAITPSTTAILPTHVYGFPCDVEQIDKIAKRHGLKVLYDAAHAFGVQYCGRSLVSYGDAAILSFHATKLFHTVEGGAIITNDDKVAHRISYMRNFGHKGYEEFWGLGINGKMSELHAAMGLAVLPHIPDVVACRRRACDLYDELLSDAPVLRPKPRTGTQWNYAYYPVVFQTEQALLRVKAAMNAEGIFPRRYFFPSLIDLPYVPKSSCRVAADVARRVLCLPLSHEVEVDVVARIASFTRAE